MSTKYDDRDRDRSQRNSREYGGRRSGQDYDRSYGQSSQGGWGTGGFDDEERRYAGESRWRGQQYGTGRALYRGGGDYESRDWGSEGESDRYSNERSRSSGRGGYGGGGYSGGERSRGYGGESDYGGGYGRETSGGRMGTEYGGVYGRGQSGGASEGYGGTSYGDEYGSSYGGGYERGEGRYRDTTGGGSYSQRSNYPGKYRSSERYGQGGRSYGEYGGGSYGEGRQYGQGREWEGRRDYEGRGGYEGRDQYREGEERGWWDRFSDTVASWFGDEEAERRLQRERPYQGRGPKGYRRSDDRIKEDVNDRLSEGYLDATEVEVSVTGGEVVLSGTVNTRYDKRRAEAIAENVSGVTNVENRLRVRDRQQYGSTYGTSQGTSSMGAATGTTGTTGTSTTGAGTTGTTGTTGTGTETGTTGSTGTSSGSARGKTAGS